MLALWERSPRTVRDVADTLFLESATLTPLLRRLEQAGYVTRARNAANERELDVRLTDQGAALRRQAEAVPRQVIHTLGVPIEALRDQLTELLGANRGRRDAARA